VSLREALPFGVAGTRDPIRDNERLMPGEGVINLMAFFQASKKAGYADGVSPEVFGRGLKDMPP